MTITEIKDLLHAGLYGDLECGVKWMNEEASAKFAANYPNLLKAIETIMELDDETENRTV